MTNHVSVTLDGDELMAVLPDGRTLAHTDPVGLAELLLAEGVGIGDVQMADWREGDSAPLTGHKLAIFARMRRGHI